MSNVKVIGIDLAKNIFQLHGADRHGNTVFMKRVTSSKLKEFMANTPPCLVAMESCGGSNYWARTFRSYGHKVKVIPAKFVKPYVTSHKNDKNDAAAIAEAATRPRIRCALEKTIKQQSIQSLHRFRSHLVKERTAIGNQIRGTLMEYGIVMPKGLVRIRENLPIIVEDGENGLDPIARKLFFEVYSHFSELDQKVKYYEGEIIRLAKEDERSRRLMKIKGIGPLTATILIATMANPHLFKNGRAFAAFLGLIPRQRSSGNKTVLLGIGKRGNSYLRYLLIHGGRAVVRTCHRHDDEFSKWVLAKKNRGGINVASVAVANKNARRAWFILAHGGDYIEH